MKFLDQAPSSGRSSRVAFTFSKYTQCWEMHVATLRSDEMKSWLKLRSLPRRCWVAMRQTSITSLARLLLGIGLPRGHCFRTRCSRVPPPPLLLTSASTKAASNSLHLDTVKGLFFERIMYLTLKQISLSYLIFKNLNFFIWHQVKISFPIWRHRPFHPFIC